MANIDVKVGVCPHDVVHDPEKWASFTSYLFPRLKLNGRFEKYFSFETFSQQFDRLNFIYAHPLDAVHVRRQHGFIPLVKYTNKFDEAVVLTHQSLGQKSLSEMEGKMVSCVYGSPSHAAVLIDFHVNNKGFTFKTLKKGSYPEVAIDVATQKVPYGIILKESWELMRKDYPGLEVLYTTYTKKLVHVFMLSPEFKANRDEFIEELLAMNESPEGKQLLKRLGCHGLEAFSLAQLEELEETLKICNF